MSLSKIIKNYHDKYSKFEQKVLNNLFLHEYKKQENVENPIPVSQTKISSIWIKKFSEKIRIFEKVLENLDSASFIENIIRNSTLKQLKDFSIQNLLPEIITYTAGFISALNEYASDEIIKNWGLIVELVVSKFVGGQKAKDIFEKADIVIPVEKELKEKISLKFYYKTTKNINLGRISNDISPLIKDFLLYFEKENKNNSYFKTEEGEKEKLKRILFTIEQGTLNLDIIKDVKENIKNKNVIEKIVKLLNDIYKTLVNQVYAGEDWLFIFKEPTGESIKLEDKIFKYNVLEFFIFTEKIFDFFLYPNEKKSINSIDDAEIFFRNIRIDHFNLLTTYSTIKNYIFNNNLNHLYFNIDLRKFINNINILSSRLQSFFFTLQKLYVENRGFFESVMDTVEEIIHSVREVNPKDKKSIDVTEEKLKTLSERLKQSTIKSIEGQMKALKGFFSFFLLFYNSEEKIKKIKTIIIDIINGVINYLQNLKKEIEKALKTESVITEYMINEKILDVLNTFVNFLKNIFNKVATIFQKINSKIKDIFSPEKYYNMTVDSFFNKLSELEKDFEALNYTFLKDIKNININMIAFKVKGGEDIKMKKESINFFKEMSDKNYDNKNFEDYYDNDDILEEKRKYTKRNLTYWNYIIKEKAKLRAKKTPPKQKVKKEHTRKSLEKYLKDLEKLDIAFERASPKFGTSSATKTRKNIIKRFFEV